jgi:uncharacterized protein YbjT (DUF2867 family)
MRTDVFVTGGTGYIGRRLIPTLVTRGHRVRALVRPGSELKVPMGATPIIGDALDRESFAWAITPDSVVVHLVGTPRPSPAKAAQFESIDFTSARECHAAALSARARHFIYVSVAHPAPVMRAYVAVRERVETILRNASLPNTILRPWYVLGPGHQWPRVLAPIYWIAHRIPALRDGANRLGLVTLDQMINALTYSIETANADSRILEVTDIRRA